MAREPHTAIPEELDLIVIGGGPGGAACGIAAARLGLRVVILERDRFPRHRLGETLTPKILPLLSFLGILRDVEAAGFVRMSGNASLLGPELEIRPFASDNRGLGFQVERERFDLILLEAAERQGCIVAEQASVVGLIREGEAVIGVEIRRPGRTHTERRLAPFVVDASGAAGFVGRSLELREVESLRTTALWGYFTGSTSANDFPDGNTVLEARPDAWIWSLPLADGRRNVTCAVDAGTVTPGALTDRYLEVVRGSRLLEPLLRTATLQGAARGVDARWFGSRHYAGPGYLLIGEAASFIDPLTSQGVWKAMNSGVLAAAVANTAIRRVDRAPLALDYFNQVERRTLRDYQIHALRLYRSTPFSDQPFWRARGRSQIDIAESSWLSDEQRSARIAGFVEAMRATVPARVHLRAAADLSIQERPCLEGGFVELRPQIVSADGRATRYHVDLPTLVPLLDGRDLDTIFEAYAQATALPRTPQSGRDLFSAIGRMVEDGVAEYIVSK
ncbi:MAG: tryptophan 7-halogenase [Candidatus Eisenbacteria bacterium]|nr:tryptophan 7-halogenase [Candidatus Eisenbacteria bacterium]